MEKILETYTVKQLKDFARKYKVRGFSTKKKAELIFMLKDNPNLEKLDMSLTYNLKKGNKYRESDKKVESKIRRIQHGLTKAEQLAKGTYKEYKPKKTVYMTKKRKEMMKQKENDEQLFLKFARLIQTDEAKKMYFVSRAMLKMIDKIATKVKDGSYQLEKFETKKIKNKITVFVKIKGASKPFKFTLTEA